MFGIMKIAMDEAEYRAHLQQKITELYANSRGPVRKYNAAHQANTWLLRLARRDPERNEKTEALLGKLKGFPISPTYHIQDGIAGSFLFNPDAAGHSEHPDYHGQIVGPKDPEVILHEFGHAMDYHEHPRLFKLYDQIGGVMKSARLPKTAPALVLGAPMVTGAVSDPDKHPIAVPVAAAAATGVPLALIKSHQMVEERNEDAANHFAKEFMAQELGSPEAAEHWFNQSHLPHARNTYRYANLAELAADTKKLAPYGLAGTALGLGAHWAKKHHAEHAQEQ